MAKGKGLPNVLRPPGANDLYKLVVFKVVSKHEDGSPWECEMVLDNQGIEIVGNEEFMTAYVPQVMVKSSGG